MNRRITGYKFLVKTGLWLIITYVVEAWLGSEIYPFNPHSHIPVVASGIVTVIWFFKYGDKYSTTIVKSLTDPRDWK